MKRPFSVNGDDMECFTLKRARKTLRGQTPVFADHQTLGTPRLFDKHFHSLPHRRHHDLSGKRPGAGFSRKLPVAVSTVDVGSNRGMSGTQMPVTTTITERVTLDRPVTTAYVPGEIVFYGYFPTQVECHAIRESLQNPHDQAHALRQVLPSRRKSRLFSLCEWIVGMKQLSMALGTCVNVLNTQPVFPHALGVVQEVSGPHTSNRLGQHLRYVIVVQGLASTANIFHANHNPHTHISLMHRVWSGELATEGDSDQFKFAFGRMPRPTLQKFSTFHLNRNIFEVCIGHKLGVSRREGGSAGRMASLRGVIDTFCKQPPSQSSNRLIARQMRLAERALHTNNFAYHQMDIHVQLSLRTRFEYVKGSGEGLLHPNTQHLQAGGLIAKKQMMEQQASLRSPASELSLQEQGTKEFVESGDANYVTIAMQAIVAAEFAQLEASAYAQTAGTAAAEIAKYVKTAINEHGTDASDPARVHARTKLEHAQEYAKKATAAAETATTEATKARYAYAYANAREGLNEKMVQLESNVNTANDAAEEARAAASAADADIQAMANVKQARVNATKWMNELSDANKKVKEHETEANNALAAVKAAISIGNYAAIKTAVNQASAAAQSADAVILAVDNLMDTVDDAQITAGAAVKEAKILRNKNPQETVAEIARMKILEIAMEAKAGAREAVAGAREAVAGAREAAARTREAAEKAVRRNEDEDEDEEAVARAREAAGKVALEAAAAARAPEEDEAKALEEAEVVKEKTKALEAEEEEEEEAMRKAAKAEGEEEEEDEEEVGAAEAVKRKADEEAAAEAARKRKREAVGGAAGKDPVAENRAPRGQKGQQTKKKRKKKGRKTQKNGSQQSNPVTTQPSSHNNSEEKSTLPNRPNQLEGDGQNGTGSKSGDNANNRTTQEF